MEKFKTKKEFYEFANDKMLVDIGTAVKWFYENDYNVFNESVEEVGGFFEIVRNEIMEYTFYYDTQKKDVLIYRES